MINFKPYSSVNESEVLALLEPLWGNMDIETRKAYFQWKYVDNPAVNTTCAFIAIDENTGKVIGFRGYYFMHYFYKQNPLKIAAYSDVVIHPDYRKQGLFEKLTLDSMKQLEKHNSVAFYNTISNNTWPSSLGYLKMGSVSLGEKSDYYRFFLLKPSVRAGDFKLTYQRDVDPVFIKKINEILSENEKITPDFTTQFLRWRYANPAQQYHFIYAYNGNQPVGFVSFYRINDKRVYLLDYATTEQAVFPKMMHAIAYYTNCRIIQTWTVSKEKRAMLQLKKAGFISLNFLYRIMRKKMQPPILIRPGTIKYKPEAFIYQGKDLRNEYNWHINLICSDGV
jgi:GNAT superfamily N-acetyltransferase